jgi:hypothetical protein
MSSVKTAQTSRTQLSGASAAMTSLASATYVAIGTITHNSSGKTPLDVLVEIYAKPGTVSGNKQLCVFAQKSLDGTNFTTGPISSTTTTDEADLFFVGVIPMATNSAQQRQVFSLRAAYGHDLPYATKLIVKNDTGAALTSTGSDHDCYTMDITGDIT